MLNLGDVIQLVVNRLQDRTVTQQQLIGQIHQPVLHVRFEMGNELNALLPQLLKQGLRQVALVPEQLAKHAFDHSRNRFAIIGIARRQAAGDDLSPIIDDQMQLEAEKPIHRVPTPGSQAIKDRMLANAAVVAHRQWGRVNETDAGAVPETVLQVGAQRHQHARHELHEAAVAHQAWKFRSQLHLHIRGVVGLEVSETHLMKVDQDRHDFTLVQLPGPLSLPLPAGELFRLPARCEALPEIIDMAVQFE